MAIVDGRMAQMICETCKKWFWRMGLTSMIVSEIRDKHGIEDNSDIYLIARGGRRRGAEKKHIMLESFYSRRLTPPWPEFEPE